MNVLSTRLRCLASGRGRARSRHCPAWTAAACALAAAACFLPAALGGCSKRVAGPPARTAAPPAAVSPPVSPAVPQRTVVHQVQPGESLAIIADNYYGDPQRWREIAERNGLRDAGKLAAGSALELAFSEADWGRAQRRAAAMFPYNRGVDALEEGRFDDAAASFQQALDIAHDFANARYNLALVHARRGRYDESEKLLAALTAERPRDLDFLFALGNVRFHQAHFAEAAGVFRRLLELAPAHRQATFGLARALQQAGQRDEAIAAWRAYLRLDPESSWADTARRALQELRGE